MATVDDLLRAQLDRLRGTPFYAARIGSATALEDVPLLTKEELRASQEADPPFGAHLCVERERLVRLHVTSGTTGEPVAIGFTAADHAANSRIGGEAFQIAGVQPTDVIAHCLNYALYAGGIADHMALEASGATVVPVGVGQSQRLLDLIPKLGITAIFGTLSFPAHLAARARDRDIDPRDLRLRRLITAGEPGAGLQAVRREIEDAWGAPVADTFGMSDVWSTMAGECGHGDGLHLTTTGHAILEVIDPDSGRTLELSDGVSGEFVWTHLQREASPLLRYRSSDLGRVFTAPCPCGRTTPRIRVDGRRDDMLRVRAVNVYPQAIGEVLGRHGDLGRWLVVAQGDPIEPPLRVYVEAPADAPTQPAEHDLRETLRAQFSVRRVAPGTLPVDEHKTRTVHRGKDPFA